MQEGCVANRAGLEFLSEVKDSSKKVLFKSIKEAEDKIQKITDKYVKNIDDIAKEKEKEILTV